MVDQIIGLLKNEKISASIIIMFGFTMWWIYGWAEERYVTRTDFGELKEIMVEHIDDMQIVNASQFIRDKELALTVCIATGRPELEIQHLKDEINEAKAYRACLIERRPNCKHLKPPE